MLWDIIRLALGLSGIAFFFIQFYNDVEKLKPFTEEQKDFINGTLIPLHDEISNKYNPEAIVFVQVSQLAEKKLVDSKKTNACVFIYDNKIVVQSIYQPELKYIIDFDKISHFSLGITKRKVPKTFYHVRIYVFLHFQRHLKMRKSLIIPMEYYHPMHKEFEKYLDPQPFINVLKANFEEL